MQGGNELGFPFLWGSSGYFDCVGLFLFFFFFFSPRKSVPADFSLDVISFF